jgi:hypothetical protein
MIIKKPEPKYPLGSRRYVIKFAYLPTIVSSGDKVWLENYHEEQSYRYSLNSQKYKWVKIGRHSIENQNDI